MNFAVILSGGIGTRMQMGDFPKQYYKVRGKMILEYTLDKFQQAEQVDAIVIVMAPVWREELEEYLHAKYSKLIGFAEPGSIRQESILSGIRFCMDRSESEEDKVIIHDGVRPLVTCALIGKCFDARRRTRSTTVRTEGESTSFSTDPSSSWVSHRRPSICISITMPMRAKAMNSLRVCEEPRRSPMRRE